VNSAEFNREIGLNSAEFLRSKKGSSNSAENMNSYEFTIIGTAPFLTTAINKYLSQIIGNTKKFVLMKAVSDASATATYEFFQRIWKLR
jgi:hypothetical protein